MTTAYIRAYIKKIEAKKKQWKYPERYSNKSNLVFVFDTETTTDERQSLKVGYYQVRDIKQDILIEHGMFYSLENCTEDEIKAIKSYCDKQCITDVRFLTREQFIKRFYNYVHFKRALCVGFNLPFDISRIAQKCSFTKGSKFHGGFSFKLTDNVAMPRIKIKANGSNFALIEFGSSLFNKGYYHHKGRFLDLHTLSMALSGEKHVSLLKAGEIFKARILKTKADEHGRITDKYLDYLMNDVFATYSLYEALMGELKNYNLGKDPEQIYSQASIGKAVLAKMGIKNFKDKNPNFPEDMLGLVMGAYYGGRSEVRYRKEPMKVTLVDFTSMYPTLNILMGMAKLLVAERIEVQDVTDEIRELLDKVTIDDLQNSEIWAKLCGMATINPEDNILPVRMRFNPKEQTKNIGICKANSDKEMPYAIPDLIASKILTGKTPKIKKAYRFVPVGMQKGLKKIDLLGLKIDPKTENIFKKLVEERQRIKNRMKVIPKDSEEYRTLDSTQKVIKLLINSTSYGIFIETNPEKSESNVNVYGVGSFECNGIYEQNGAYYNPIMAVTITSGARLFLAMIEAMLIRMGKQYAFCDTDSMAVPSETAKGIINFFQKLCPYGEGIRLLKEEEADVWFYGLSAKRYVLYRKTGDEFEIVKYSLHGLGHLKNPFGDKRDWHKEIWLVILKRHYGLMTDTEIEEEYGSLKAVSQLTISTQNLWKQIKVVNDGQTYNEQIKPFGFVSVGFGTRTENGQIIKPIAPFDNDTQKVARQPFIDSKTGKKYQGEGYWKTLSDIIFEYIDHPESKFDGDTGFLSRKSVTISGITYIGKEVKKLEQQHLGLEHVTEYQNREDIYDRILKMSNKEAESRGVTRSALWKIKKKIREGKKVNLRCRAVRDLIN